MHATSCQCAALPGVSAPLQLADFGFSKDANQHSAPTSRVGTPAYLAPEVITNQPGQVYDGQVRAMVHAGWLRIGTVLWRCALLEGGGQPV